MWAGIEKLMTKWIWNTVLDNFQVSGSDHWGYYIGFIDMRNKEGGTGVEVRVKILASNRKMLRLKHLQDVQYTIEHKTKMKAVILNKIEIVRSISSIGIGG